ncbi:long-chain fatty acid--CoA ligase [Bacteroidales bacterium]|nr:long-chain fatty acid--CoA ligase [Bacteroidales bacterium]
MRDVKRVFDILELYAKRTDKDDVLAGRQANEWIKYSASEYCKNANWFSYGLMTSGFRKGDKVAVITNNRPEWNFIDMGCQQIGVVTVPIHTTFSIEDIEYILKHSEPKYLFIAEKSMFAKLSDILQNIESIQDTYTVDKIPEARNWIELLCLGKDVESDLKNDLIRIKSEISENDLLSIIYTSGTTGYPKGVMLNHKNLVTNFKATSHCHIYDHNHKTLSFLPLSHIYERMLNYNFQYKGLSIYYAENLSVIAQCLKDVQPEIFSTVPRLLEQVYDKFMATGKSLKGIKKRIYAWSVKQAKMYNPDKPQGKIYLFKRSLADKLVFSKWREALGGKLEVVVSGGAALQPRLAKVFGAAGIQVLEGYGLTETSPVIAVNNQPTKEARVGTVGPVLPGVEVKIADDGEILCRGDLVMQGYYKAPDITAEVIDEDGWFHTGDAGEFIDGKFLKITDRKKEIFKLSNGKYIAPQVIENKFKESLFIEQIMVVGENEKYASAIVSPNLSYLHNWATVKKITYRDNSELIENKKVIQRFSKEIKELNKRLGPAEQIKKFKLISDEWVPANGLLSPTLKLKRKRIAEKYNDIISKFYVNSNYGDD